jgi:fructokinase
MTVNLIGLGEVLWDLLPVGPQLGGAPANFAYHVHALGKQVGAQAEVITRVGNDNYGREAIRRFHEIGLDTTSVQVDETAPTGTAKVELSTDGAAHFTIEENVAWDFLALTDGALAVANKSDAICFGTLAQRCARSRTAIQQLVAASPANTLRVLDINLRQPFYSRGIIKESLQLANVLKLNDEELQILAEMFTLPSAIENQIKALARRFSLSVVALTRGPNGSLLYKESEKRWSDYPPRPIKVVDTVGAGDSFTAALVLGLLRKMDLDKINEIANEVARYVCSQPGATPQLPLEFAQRFSASQ